jgi:hypothetical protein
MNHRFTSSTLLTAIVALGLASGAYAASVQTLANPVPNGFIKLDGNISDWLSLAGFNQDTIGDGSTGGVRLDIDILQGAVAHDANFFYFLFRNAGDNMIDNASNWVMIDLDQNDTTGYLGGPTTPLAVGAEYNLGGTTGWNKWNPDGSHAGAAAGRTLAVGDSNASGGNDFIEYAVSRTAAQPGGGTFNPVGTSFNLVFVGEDTTPDYSPNIGDVDWFTYNASGVYNPGAPGDANGAGGVTIDDYLLIQANSFTIVPLGTMGDVDDTGFVDFGDFRQWKENFPGGVAAAEAAIASLVPEPGSISLAAAGLLGLIACGRRHRRR